MSECHRDKEAGPTQPGSASRRSTSPTHRLRSARASDRNHTSQLMVVVRALYSASTTRRQPHRRGRAVGAHKSDWSGSRNSTRNRSDCRVVVESEISGPSPHIHTNGLGCPLVISMYRRIARLQLARAPMDAPAQLILGQRCEPAFDELDPRRARGREVQVESRVARPPSMDGGCLMRAGLVEDQTAGATER